MCDTICATKIGTLHKAYKIHNSLEMGLGVVGGGGVLRGLMVVVVVLGRCLCWFRRPPAGRLWPPPGRLFWLRFVAGRRTDLVGREKSKPRNVGELFHSIKLRHKGKHVNTEVGCMSGKIKASETFPVPRVLLHHSNTWVWLWL